MAVLRLKITHKDIRMKYAKIRQDGSLEFAPINNHGTSNWILKTDEVLAEGYLPVEEAEGDIEGYEVSGGKIVAVFKQIEDVVEEAVKPIDPTIQRIQELKAKLFATDYIACKIIEALDYSEQAYLKEKYADVIAKRRQWRAELNDLLEEID